MFIKCFILFCKYLVGFVLKTDLINITKPVKNIKKKAIPMTCRQYIFITVKTVSQSRRHVVGAVRMEVGYTYFSRHVVVIALTFLDDKSSVLLNLFPTTSCRYRVRIKLSFFENQSRQSFDDTDDIFDIYWRSYVDNFLQTKCRLYKLYRRHVVRTVSRIVVYISVDPCSAITCKNVERGRCLCHHNMQKRSGWCCPYLAKITKIFN